MLAKFFPIALALAISIGALAELAFTKSRVFTVSGALTEADTSVVTVRGLAVPLGDNRFILADNTGRCELQTCPKWFRTVDLRPNEPIAVTGEIIRNISPSHGTLYPLAVQKIERDHAPEIIVRQGIGRPSWMMGKKKSTR